MLPTKAVFKISKCEKHGETLEFFLGALILSNVDSLAIALLKRPISWPNGVHTTIDTFSTVDSTSLSSFHSP
jgi:hypothetical protein